MPSYPYISGPGNLTQMIGYLKRNFPATVTSETVKRYGLASNNESYVINALHFIGLIDETGKRTEIGHDVLTTTDEAEFQEKFSKLIVSAYAELFDIYNDDAWTLPRLKLVHFFRQANKTSEAIGNRQAGVFQAFRALAGFEKTAEPKTVSSGPKKAPPAQKAMKPRPAKSASAVASASGTGESVAGAPPKSDIALTVRIEINLPAEGSQETYDAIFKSIKANLYP